MYKLVGVVVHRGAADFGHYFSYIDTKHSGINGSTWVEFNDSKVIPFDIENLESQCFGGINQNSNDFEMNGSYNTSDDIS